MKFKEVVVVEGLHDVDRLRKIYGDIDVLITNGSEIDKHLQPILEVAKTREIILFLDPDHPGERIRKILSSYLPNAKHAFLRKNLAISKNHRKVGVEHAKKEDIMEALDRALTPFEEASDIKQNDLYELGYIGKKDSSFLRDKLASALNIGHTNAKTLLKRLRIFGIKKEVLKLTTDEIKKA